MKLVSAIPGYLTMQEAAERLGIVHSGVARYVRKGRLPCAQIGQQKLIPEKAISDFERRPVGRPARNPEKVA